MTEDIDYERDAQIDESSLDVELLEQPRLMMRYAQRAVVSREEMDRAKDEVEVVKAELDLAIREDPDGYGLPKLTETTVQSAIQIQDKYKQALSDLNTARQEHEMAKYAVTAIEQRKHALENLVKLHGMQYFAGPSTPRDLSYERQARDRNKRSNATVGRSKRTRKPSNAETQ